MDFNLKIKEKIGAANYKHLIDSIEDGTITQQKVQDIGLQMNPKVNGVFKAKLEDKLELKDVFRYMMDTWWKEELYKEEYNGFRELVKILEDDDVGLKFISHTMTDPGMPPTGLPITHPDITQKTESKTKEDLFYKFKRSIKNGEHSTLQKKIKKLQDFDGKEIFLSRKFMDINTGQEIDDIEKLVLEEKTTLLQGVAGAGKTSVSVKILQQWSEDKILKNITCCLFLVAGSEEKIPLYKIIWGDYKEVSCWNDRETEEIYKHLQVLAKEGKLAVIIDGLDEFGVMKRNDVDNATMVAKHPAKEVDIKTACLGILTKKILPGAKVLATGRNTGLVNKEVLEKESNLYALVDLTKADRTSLVEKMEQDKQERSRIEGELERVAIEGNVYFLKTPLMLRNIIRLVIKRKVDIKRTRNSSEIYLMLLLQHLDWHTGFKENYTELDPPEDQKSLVKCLQICQEQLQAKEGQNKRRLDATSINTIEGIPKNDEELGQIIEFRKQEIKIPVTFVKKLGIFEYTKEGGRASLNIIHLSFLEFCTAASLCRPKIDIQEELNKIEDPQRFEAVVTYLAGLFNENQEIDFLTECRNICENFLDLLQTRETRDESVQTVFRSIMTRNDKTRGRQDEDNHIQLSSAEDFKMSFRMIEILVDAMTASSDKIKISEIKMVKVPKMKTSSEARSVTNLVMLQQGQVDHLEIGEAECKNTEDVESLVNLLRLAKQWSVKKLELSDR